MSNNQYTADSYLVSLKIPNKAGVYRIRDKVSGADYIGSSKRIRYRISQHFSVLKSQKPVGKTYQKFAQTYAEHGIRAFDVAVLIICDVNQLAFYEKQCVAAYTPTENTYYKPVNAELCAERSRRTTALWQRPEYREKACAARRGNTFCKGYKCTPEQIENRKRAARISNMKRNYGVEWAAEYIRRYPEHAGDVNGSTLR